MLFSGLQAGRTVVFVDPRNTSKMCSRCGQLVEKTLADRVHHCSCGLVLNRDENAAINILSLGLKTLGLVPGSRLLQLTEQSLIKYLNNYFGFIKESLDKVKQIYYIIIWIQVPNTIKYHQGRGKMIKIILHGDTSSGGVISKINGMEKDISWIREYLEKQSSKSTTTN